MERTVSGLQDIIQDLLVKASTVAQSATEDKLQTKMSQFKSEVRETIKDALGQGFRAIDQCFQACEQRLDALMQNAMRSNCQDTLPSGQRAQTNSIIIVGWDLGRLMESGFQYGLSSQDLRSHFQKYGAIGHIEFLTHNVIDQGDSTENVAIGFRTEEAKQEALRQSTQQVSRIRGSTAIRVVVWADET
eukprot:gnl/MRDRNA2_/MRDRNA2_109830_c0_seq1.p1 gnl/MRDRNA2_/MRDRNA2_109830_c0~~gnl/MRDRNA2_/MRDRNA2_109830_c0_seq1.p1  ORF type:complete len:189 (-),score=32.98 gnl/MRDRNA2_/MRDRNA2_109830_c0_seq1:733-1299(-)